MKKYNSLKINKYFILIGFSVIILSVIFFSFNNKNNDKALAEVSALQENQLYKFDISSFSSDNKTAYLNGTNAAGGSNINLTNFNYTDYSNWYIKQGNTVYNITSMSGNRAMDRVAYNFSFTGYSKFVFVGGSSYTETLQYYYSGNYIAFPSSEDIYLHIGSLSRNNDATSDSKNVTNNFISNIVRYLNIVQTDYNVTYSITNGSASPLTIQPNTTNTLQITPDNGYTYPETINYTGTAADVQYYNDTGEIVITNPSSDFTITAECQSNITTIEVGYYLIYPPEIPSTADTIELSYHIINLLSSTIGNSEPLTPVISSTLYNYLDRQTGLQSGLFALTSLQDSEPLELWRDYQDNEQLNGAIIIYVPSQTTIIGQHDLINCLLSITYEQYDALRYWGYGIAVSPNTKSYDIGYTEGYDVGINTNIIADSTTGVIEALFNGLFGTIFNIEIFPNFPLYIFILIPIVFGMLGLIFWLIRGR